MTPSSSSPQALLRTAAPTFGACELRRFLHDARDDGAETAPIVEIPVTRGMVAIIDAADLWLVEGQGWHAHKARNGWYARSNIKPLCYLHQLLVAPRLGFDVDHINGNGLDNRRVNLRQCTHAENLANYRSVDPLNSSKYKGVSFHKRDKVWRADICKNGARKYLGAFNSETEAALAYDTAAKQIFGEFARLNFPSGYVSAPHGHTMQENDPPCRRTEIPTKLQGAEL